MKKKLKMVYKDHYNLLSDDAKSELRDVFLSQTGLSLPSFYYKMRANSFKKMEETLLVDLFNVYGLNLQV